MDLRFCVALVTVLVVSSKEFPCGEDFGNAEGKPENEKLCRRCKGETARLVSHAEFAEGLGYSTCSLPHETGWEGFERNTPDLGSMEVNKNQDEDVAEALPHELTVDNWDQRTKGQKDIFVKFYAPWCGHCLSMKPDWEKLIDEFKSNSDVGIWSVDCVGSGKGLCAKFGVRSYPTLQFGDPTNIGGFQNYGGPRNYDEFKGFVVQAFAVGASCDPANLDTCTESEKDSIKFYQKKTAKFLTTEVERLEKKFKKKRDKLTAKQDGNAADMKKLIKDIEHAEEDEEDAKAAELEKKKEKLETEMEEVSNEFKELDETRRESDVDIMRSVKSHKDKGGHDEL